MYPHNSDHDLLEDIGNGIALEGELAHLMAAQRQELDRRIEDYKKDPSGNIPWETIRSEALSRE